MLTALRAMYRGENDFPIVARRRLYLALSGIALLVSLFSLSTRRLSLGIDFEGGSLLVARVTADVTESQVRGAAGLADAHVVFVTEGEQRKVRVSSRESTPEVVDRVKQSLAALPGSSADTIEVTSVGPSWGAQISRKALQALVVFLVAVTIYISLRFEWKMAIAALAALAHDVVITAGVYSLVGFTVVPATVIATLTILGYSLYDTVVVFDKIQENTSLAAQTARQTYADTVNGSLNQVLMRSLNTSLVSLLPVGSLLAVGLTTSAAGTLKDFALALFVGLLSGTYSSIFFATPILVILKEREPRYQAIRARLETRAGREPERRSEEATEEVVAAAPARPSASRPPARRGSQRGASRPRGSRRSGGGKRRR